MAKKILAVAIGDPNNSTQIKTATDANSDTVRPYVRGLISWLATQAVPPKAKNLTKFQIGTTKDYVIDYRECRDSNNDTDLDALLSTYGSSADLIFCMSTTVARRAAHLSAKPIVAVVSDPKRETTFGSNVCGVSAMRSQNTGDCYEEFRSSLPDLTRIYILHKAGYTPSEDADYWLPNDSLNVLVPIALTDNIATTISNLDQAPTGETYGILVLPADRFFGDRKALIDAATLRGFPTYWSVTDFVDDAGGAFGGCGVPQVVAGRFMAERVANIWTKNAIPSPPFVPIPKKYIDSKLAHAVAKALKLKLARKKKTQKKSKQKPRKSKKR
jgi:hypothetical protein